MSSDIYTVKEGAKLACTLGTAESELKVPQSHGVSIQDGNEATIMDSVSNVNIFTFKTCNRQVPPVPCVPATVMPWINGKRDYVLDNQLALINICLVPCMFGGVITIKESGQK